MSQLVKFWNQVHALVFINPYVKTFYQGSFESRFLRLQILYDSSFDFEINDFHFFCK